MVNTKTAFLAVILSSALSSAAFAGAHVSGISGSVLVNQGAGFQTVTGSAALKAGDRVLVNIKSSGVLKFADGCSVSLKPGIVTISKTSPCAVKAQGETGGGFAIGPLVGFGVVLGVGALTYAAEEASSKSP